MYIVYKQPSFTFFNEEWNRSNEPTANELMEHIGNDELELYDTTDTE